MKSNLAVEHIQPKGLPQYDGLKCSWDNFLLGCINCNSTKGDKDVLLDQCFLPDRDNTFAAYAYTLDGKVEPSQHLTAPQRQMALNTLSLTDLDKAANTVIGENGKLIAIDRFAQRMEAFLTARDSLQDLETNPTPELRRQIARTATAVGFFSIWMTVFGGDTDMRRRFIEAFLGTAGECFDANTNPIPRRDNGLLHAGKV